MPKIELFRGEHRFLSNFYPARVLAEWNEVGYPAPTVEHAYQAMKAMNRRDFDEILGAPTAGDAKRMGRRVVIRSAWEAIKIQVMESLLRQKFEDPELRRRLDATRGSELIEGNHWRDHFWGVCNGRGENHLGKLLMKIRDE